MDIFNFFKKQDTKADIQNEKDAELKRRLAAKVKSYDDGDDDTMRDFTLQTRNKTDTTYYEMQVDDNPVEMKDTSTVEWEDPRFRLNPDDFDDDTVPNDLIRFIGTNIHKK